MVRLDGKIFSALLKPHTHTILRPERHRGQKLDRVAWREPQAEAASDGREYERGLHQRERVADALSRAAAEGEVRELREARGCLFVPAFGAELRRLVVPARVALDDPLEGEDLHPGGDAVAADLAVAHGLATDGVSRRVESH